MTVNPLRHALSLTDHIARTHFGDTATACPVELITFAIPILKMPLQQSHVDQTSSLGLMTVKPLRHAVSLTDPIA